MLATLSIGGTVVWKTAGFLFDFQLRIHVGFEQNDCVAREMPYFVKVHESIAFVERFHDFGRAPRSSQLTLFRRVVATPLFFEERFGDVILSTGSAQGEHELLTTTIR